MGSTRRYLTGLGARLLKARGVVRSPIAAYRAGFGWIFGRRFLLLEHRGRSSGERRYAVLEVVIRESADSLITASGFGEKAQWFQNLLPEPRCGVSTGFQQRVPATASAVDPVERDLLLRAYQQQHPGAWSALQAVIREATGEQNPHIPLMRLQRRRTVTTEAGTVPG